MYCEKHDRYWEISCIECDEEEEEREAEFGECIPPKLRRYD